MEVKQDQQSQTQLDVSSEVKSALIACSVGAFLGPRRSAILFSSPVSFPSGVHDESTLQWTASGKSLRSRVNQWSQTSPSLSSSASTCQAHSPSLRRFDEVLCVHAETSTFETSIFFSFRGAKIPPTIGLFVVLDGVVQASTCDFA